MADCVSRIRGILAVARNRVWQRVNAAMVSAYWEIGREIVEEEQRGRQRAEYGAQLLRQLPVQLSDEFGKGYSERNLRYIRQFYRTYADRLPPIRHTPSAELPAPEKIRNTLCSESGEPQRVLVPDLSWSHYRLLMRVVNPEARDFYEVECVKAGWSVRELQATLGHREGARGGDSQRATAPRNATAA